MYSEMLPAMAPQCEPQETPFVMIAQSSAISHLAQGGCTAPLAVTAIPPPPSAPALGTPDLPSAGSVGHAAGQCKPCAFFHSGRCSNDLSCQFCHLCDAGEKKRRRREKLESRRSAHKM